MTPLPGAPESGLAGGGGSVTVVGGLLGAEPMGGAAAAKALRLCLARVSVVRAEGLQVWNVCVDVNEQVANFVCTACSYCLRRSVLHLVVVVGRAALH